MLTPDDRAALALIKDLHNLEISEEDFAAFQEQRNELLHYLKSERSRSLSEQQVDYIPDIENTAGQGIGTALGIIAGVALSFTGIGSAIGIATLIAIGASVGYQLGGMIDPPNVQQQKDNQSNKEKQARNAYGFDSVPSLITYGEPVPAIYTNRYINPNGGVRTTGALVSQRVDTINGAQRLIQLYSLGEGPIGEIAEAETRFDNQSLDTFSRNEISQEFRLGTPGQPAFGDAHLYSNCVSPSANSTIGCDLRSLVESVRVRRKDILAEPQLLRNGSDYTSASKRIDFQKDDGEGDDGYALFVSQEALRIDNGKRESGFVEATPIQKNRRVTIGISTVRDPGADFNSLPFCFLCRNDGTWQIRESGAIVANGVYGRKNSFAIEYLGNAVYYRQNQNVVYVSTRTPVYPARLAVGIYNEAGIDADGARVNKLFFGKNVSYSKGRIFPSNTTAIEVGEDELERFSLADNYRVRGKKFTIVNKNYDTNSIIVQDPLNLREDDEIYAIWEAKFETSRKVNRIDVNLAAQLWARNPRGELIRHGQVFDLFIKPKGQPWVRLQRFYLSNNVDVTMRRSFRILNLPLNYYQVELLPLERPNGAQTIEKLGETGDFQRWDVGTIGANTIQIEAQIEDRPSLEAVQKACDFEGIFDDPDDDAEMDEDALKGRKRQVCTQQGATLRVTTINEIEIGPAVNYEGFATARLVFRASDRMSTAPTPSFLITKGLIDRMYLAAGTVSTTSTAQNTILTMTDLTASFLDDDIREGDTLRNLSEYRESPIVSFTGTTIVTQTSLSFTRGDRYLVYRRDSSCYFPDIYASRLSESYGIGAAFNTDEFLDAVAFVYGRKFCARRRLYWDGKIKEAIRIDEWAQQEAPASLIQCSIIDGMRSLTPEEETPIQGLFTAANADNWKEGTTEFTKRLYNRLIVTYTNGADDDKLDTITIETPDAYHKRVPWYEENVTFINTKNRNQAVSAGALLLKSRILQDRASNWDTGLYGVYIRPGGLVHAQHTITEWQDERSGLIYLVAPNPTGNGGYFLEASFPVDQAVTRSGYRATIQYRNTGRIDYDLYAELRPDQATRKVFVTGTSQIPQPGDLIALGEDREERRTFKVNSVEPTEDIGVLQLSAIVWTRDMLDLSNLYIDGQCIGGIVPSDIPWSESEMRSWLAAMDAWFTENTRDTAPFIINNAKMLVNAYHGTADEAELGRAGYFAAASFTSEGQFTAIESSAFVFQVTGVQSWKDRAIAMGNAAVSILYGGDPIPTNTQTVWLPHWLGNAGAPFTSKGLVASNPENSGHFDATVSFSNGVGQLSAAQSASTLADVYIVRTSGSRLLWRSVTADVIPDSASLPINYWVSSVKGRNYKIYSSSSSSAGTPPTPTTEPLGRIQLATNYSGSALVVYSSYSGPVIQRNQLYDAAPMWRSLESGERNCAMDVIGWAWQSYDLLYSLTRDEKWLRARNATAYSLIQTAQVENLSYYHKKSDNDRVFSYPGSQAVIVNNSAGYTASRVTSGDKKDWIRIDVADGSESFPSLEYQNFAVQTQVENKVRIKVEAAVSQATMLEIVMSTNPDAFTFTDLYKAYWLVSGGGTPQTITFEAEDMIRWRTDKDIVWHPAIADTPIYTYQGGSGSATASRRQIKLGGINPVVWELTLNGNSGFAGAGFVFAGLGAATKKPPSLYLNHEGDNAILRVTDGSGRKWDTVLPSGNGWTKFSPDWGDFRRASTESGDQEPDQNQNIQAVEIQSAGGESVTTVYYLTTSSSAKPEVIPVPARAYKAALVSKITTAHTLWIGEFRPLNNDAEILPYSPSILPFTANFLGGVLRAYRGNPYAGYQIIAWLWARLGYADRAETMTRFLLDAQDAYFKKTNVDFALAPTFVWGYWDSLKYAEGGQINVFSDRGDDPSTFWIGYLTRPLEATAYYLYQNPGSANAQRIVTRSLTWLKNHYEQQQSGRPPTNIYYRSNSPIESQYLEPHAAAMIMRLAIYSNLAGVDASVSYPVIQWSYRFLKTQWVTNPNDNMFGTFSAGQPVFVSNGQTYRQMFGFWSFEIAKSIALLLKERSNLRYPCG